MTERMSEELVFVVCSQSGGITAVVELFEPDEDFFNLRTQIRCALIGYKDN